MPQNSGKKFETDFKASVPQDVWYYRFPDSPASFGGGENTRFSTSNICDCMMFGNQKLFLAELKSHKGKSIPFNCIRENQIEQMQKAATFTFIIPILVINFADVERCFAVHINDFAALMDSSTKKSANIAEIEMIGDEISMTKKVSHYRYGIDEYLKRWQ